MSIANIAEVRTCIEQCVAYCDKHPDEEYCERHGKRLREILSRLNDTREESDDFYTDWRAAIKEQRQKWKEVSGELAEVQDALEKVNAVGFPDMQTRYWDEERLAEVVGDMVEYLEENSDDIEFADDAIDRLERKLDSAEETLQKESKTRDAYKRKVKKRSEAMQDATAAIGDFRDELRQVLGPEHDDYQSIRWPYAIAPDESLF